MLYAHQATLFAVPFDLETLTVTGNAVPVVEGVLSSANTGGAHFSVSDSGTLVYVSGRSVGRESPIHLLDATGKTTLHRNGVADWYFPRFSPDGRKLAVTIGGGAASDIWIHEPERDLTKFTFENGPDFAPVWTPDGTRIAFASVRTPSGVPNLYWQRSNGTGGVERLTESSHPQTPYSFHPSGKYLAFSERNAAGLNDIMILPFDGDEKSGWKPGTPTVFLSTPFNEAGPMFSPDGRWLAYISNESGSAEIYVRPFPTGEGKWKISNSGGIFPAWSLKRTELLYLVPGQQQRVMAVSYDADGDLFETRGVPREWSPQPIMSRLFDRSYDLHPDGLRIAMIKPPDQLAEERDKAVFVFNFFDELRRIAGGK